MSEYKEKTATVVNTGEVVEDTADLIEETFEE
jgi:hypothetical protein